MYSIVFDFINQDLFGGVSSALVPLLTDTTMILIYIALVMFVIWMYKTIAGAFDL